jgi:hypothetical protein
MDSKILHGGLVTLVATIISYLYSKIIVGSNDGDAYRVAFRSAILTSLSYALVHYMTEGGRDAVLNEPFYSRT